MLVSDDYTFHNEPNMRCDADTQYRAFAARSYWTRTMEQSSIAPERGGLIVQYIPAVAKDIFV